MNIVSSKSTLRRKCPKCFNYMSVNVLKDGSLSGKCPTCKSVIQSKKPNSKVTLIRIVEQ